MKICSESHQPHVPSKGSFKKQLISIQTSSSSKYNSSKNSLEPNVLTSPRENKHSWHNADTINITHHDTPSPHIDPMLRIQEPVLYPLTLHPNLQATTNDALHQSFQKKKEIHPKPTGPSSLNPAQNNKKNLSISQVLRQKLPPPSSLLQTTSQVTLNHRQQPTKTKKMQVLFPTQTLSNNNVTKNHDTIFQTSPKGIQKNLGPHAFKNLQKQLLQPQLSPHFARFFCSNPTKKLSWGLSRLSQQSFLVGFEQKKRAKCGES
jgi:hypothetical protein